MATQFDIIRNQAEAAARNAAARATGSLRRDTSLVNQASRWAGRTLTEGEADLRRKMNSQRRAYAEPQETVGERIRPLRPAADGYVRRSPIQPLRVIEGYRKRQVLRAAAVAAVIVAICVGIYLLNLLGVFGR